MMIEVKDLEKKYKKDWVLKGVNFQMSEPETVALVGPNGSGKTTLLNCMANLITYNKGSISLLDKDHKDPSIFYDVAYLQDNRILYGHLTALDHLKFICSIQKIPLARIDAVVERVGMGSYLTGQSVQKFSLGMKQHLLLAMAILNEPKLLLMDEPLNGLDPTSAVNMRNILLELQKEGTAIIVSSHNLDEIDRLTNKIYFMKDGLILEEDLTNFAAKKYYIKVSDLQKAEKLLNELSFPWTVNSEKQIVFEDKDVSIQAVIKHLNDHDVQIEQIENVRIGAEKRYYELFEGNESI